MILTVLKFVPNVLKGVILIFVGLFARKTFMAEGASAEKKEVGDAITENHTIATKESNASTDRDIDVALDAAAARDRA